MIEVARRALERMRDSAAAWSELRYERATDRNGHDCDANAVRRAMVLWALQYDRRPADLPLLRWLAEQEAQCRAQAPFQGLSREAELAGLLLAEHRQVQDVWLQWKIKMANFDTVMGYEGNYLWAAGVEVTLDEVRHSDHAERDRVLDWLHGNQGMTEEDVVRFLDRKRLQFPADPAAEDPGIREERVRFVAEWGAD